MTCPAPDCTLVKGHGVHHSNEVGKIWEDLRPTSGKAEIHLTLACDLDCSACNRASFLKSPHTPSMTLDDLREFFRQADALNWKPRLTLVGGEPTLHPDFKAFVSESIAWTGGGRVQIWSNAYRSAARELVQIGKRLGASACKDTEKQDGARRGPLTPTDYWVDDTFISPADFGMVRDACFQSASVICGISVDAHGYSPCALGGTIAALLGAEGRTQTLADLFDKDKAAAMQHALCEHCGQQWMSRTDVSHLPKYFDTPMSPTWEKAFQGRR